MGAVVVQFLYSYLYWYRRADRSLKKQQKPWGKTSGSFSVKKLLIGKTAFNDNSIVFIFYKCQVIIVANELG